MTWEKYGSKAHGWSDTAYADAHTYLARRAELVRTLGPSSVPATPSSTSPAATEASPTFSPSSGTSASTRTRR